MEAAGTNKRAQLLRSRSLPAPELEHRLPTFSENGAKEEANLLVADSPAPATTNSNNKKVDGNKTATIRQHYYPEGGWGWVVTTCACFVQLICHGLHMAYGVLYSEILQKFGYDRRVEAAWLGGLSASLSMLLTPVIVALCRRKSTRLTGVLGGLVTALGCLFSSFASQFHQLFFSYGIMIGIGVGLVRDTSNLMVGQYFKRKRETVEVFVVGSSGLGIAITSLLIRQSIKSVGWRLGLQAVTGVVFLSFFLGVCYRSASLYHPQRRAILHLKNQKRKLKDKNKTEDKPPFFDFATLKSRTVQIILVAAAIAAFGINTPIVFLVLEAEQDGLSAESVLLIQVFLGMAFALGCGTIGFLTVRNSAECRIARQYLCQASAFMVSVTSLAFTAVHGYHGYILFAWIYGIFCGGYHYSLKMYAYEKVRARNFARAWSFVQWAQSIPMALGLPITGYMNGSNLGDRSGYYFCSICVLASSIVLFLVDVHKRRIHKLRGSLNGPTGASRRKCSSASCAHAHLKATASLPELDEVGAGHIYSFSGMHPRAISVGTCADLKRAELTCISEEGIADLGDNLFDDYDQFLADCMTSCDQVENYLMLSEYENNLIKTRELDSLLDRGKRRKSMNKVQTLNGVSTESLEEIGGKEKEKMPSQVVTPTRRPSRDGSSTRSNAWKLLQNSSRSITVIDEITTVL